MRNWLSFLYMISYAMLSMASVLQKIHTHPHTSQHQGYLNTASRPWSDLMIKISWMQFILVSNVNIIKKKKKKKPSKTLKITLILCAAKVEIRHWLCFACLGIQHQETIENIIFVRLVRLTQREGDRTKLFFVLKPFPLKKATIKYL